MRRLTLLLLLTVALPASAADEAIAPACLDEIEAFAEARSVPFEASTLAFGPRWAGAGHEVSRLPGLRARLPVENCSGTLALDLGPNCRVLKSRGEKGCRSAYPLTFH